VPLQNRVKARVFCKRLKGAAEKVAEGARSAPQALKRGHIFNGLTARLKPSPFKTESKPAAKAAIDFAVLNGTAEAVPLQSKVKNGVFPQHSGRTLQLSSLALAGLFY
jgi:hypothetical protein